MELDTRLSSGEKLELLRIARKGVEAAARHQKYLPESPVSPQLCRKAGAFVTLHIHGELRGCIGYIEAALPMYETVAQTAGKSAVADPRFEPVSEQEVREIEIEISVLSPLVRINRTEEVIVGKHGVLIERGYNRGLLLPQVATENNWDLKEFLEYTCMKAGIDKELYKDAGTRIYVFTADVFGESEFGKISEENLAERT